MSSKILSIADDDVLSRFVTDKDWVRADGTAKPDAIMPHKGEVSVTVRWGLGDEALWEVGALVVAEIAKKRRDAKLLGRLDLDVGLIRRNKLTALHAPTLENPNHAAIRNWPDDKPACKVIALKVMKASVYREFSATR